jgi:hypothetical protein
LAKVIEQVEAGYEVEEVEFGTVYRWCPESVVVRCVCGGEAVTNRLHKSVKLTTY